MLMYESMGNMESEDAGTLTLQHVCFQIYIFTQFINFKTQMPFPRSVNNKRTTRLRHMCTPNNNNKDKELMYLHNKQCGSTGASLAMILPAPRAVGLGLLDWQTGCYQSKNHTVHNKLKPHSAMRAIWWLCCSIKVGRCTLTECRCLLQRRSIKWGPICQ